MTITAPELGAVARSRARDSAGATLLLVAAVGAAILFAHRQALTVMVELWQASPMYSYGFTVPLISAYLLWQRWPVLSRLPRRPAVASAVAVLALSVAMTTAARAGGIQVLDQLAFLVSLTAAVLLLFGFAHLRAAWASLAYLLLMIPLWDGLTERLHVPFQLKSAEIGAWMLQTIGIPAFRQDMFIALPNLTIEVARACSGVNYLVAVFALGLPLAYLYLPGVWRRVALLVSALVVAALSNGLRVALIGTLAYLEVGSPLHGPFHMLHGLFVAGIGYVVLFVGLRLLTPRPSRGAPYDAAEPQSGAAAPMGSVSSEKNDAPHHAIARGPVAWAAAAVALFLVVGLNGFSPTPKHVPLNGDLDAIPRQLGSWVSERSLLDGRGTTPPVWLGADAEMNRRYLRPDGVAADVYVGYFSSQSQGKEVITHRATELHNRASRVTLTLGGSGRSFDANVAPAGRDGVVTLFWYEVGRRPEANRFVVKGRTLWSAMARGESSAAVVVLTTRAGEGQATAALQELAPLVEAAVAARLPGGAGVLEE
jgi:EpsI family protein